MDTNVMAHADHPANAYHESALPLLAQLRDEESVRLVLDDQGKTAPDLSTSVLASEYRSTLSPQGYALTLFAYLLAAGRVNFAARPDRATRTTIGRLIPRNNSDRAVLGAATGCEDRLLVTNDYDDFSESVRASCQSQLGVDVLDSEDAVR